jgi:aminoglycoside phosphotransferase (APT) family kinase protein
MSAAFEIGNLALAQAKAGRSRDYRQIATHLALYVERVLAHLDIQPAGVTVLDGETNVTMRVDTAEARYVLKISPWPDDLSVSTYYYQRLEATGAPIPRVVAFDDSRTVIPYDVQVLAWIDGTDGRDLPPQFQEEAGRLMGRALRQIHGLNTDGVGSPLPAGGWSAASWREALRQNVGYDRRVTHTLFRSHEIAAIEAIVLDDARVEPAQPRLIHGDIVSANGLYRIEGGAVRLVGLIDPGGMVGGDPMFDLAGGTDTQNPFARGLWAGYVESRALTGAEEYRYRRLLLWSYYTAACWHHATGRDSAPWKERTLEALTRLRPPGRDGV